MARVFRSAMVATLVAVLVVPPAAAYHCYYGYYESYWSPCAGGCEPVDCWSPCDGVVVESPPCGCDGEVTDEGPSGAAREPMAVPEPSGPTNVHRPVEPMPAVQPGPADSAAEHAIAPALPPSLPEEEPQSTPSADELFGPPTETPSTPPVESATEEPAPVEEPTEDARPMEEESAEPEPTLPPAEEPSDDEPTGFDLFETEESPPESAPADEPTGDDFFGTGDDASAPAEEPSAEETPAEEEPADAESTEEEQPAPAEEDEDDVFGGFGAILREPGGLASVELRRWIDNTGHYSCQGRLIRLLDGKVQLLKDSGRTTTVLLERLSRADLAFVNRQASARHAESLGQTAQVPPLRSAR